MPMKKKIPFFNTRVESPIGVKQHTMAAGSSPLRSTLNTNVITGLDMCKVCTEAVHCVALWTRTLSQVWTCVKYVPKQSMCATEQNMSNLETVTSLSKTRHLKHILRMLLISTWEQVENPTATAPRQARSACDEAGPLVWDQILRYHLDSFESLRLWRRGNGYENETTIKSTVTSQLLLKINHELIGFTNIDWLVGCTNGQVKFTGQIQNSPFGCKSVHSEPKFSFTNCTSINTIRGRKRLLKLVFKQQYMDA